MCLNSAHAVENDRPTYRNVEVQAEILRLSFLPFIYTKKDTRNAIESDPEQINTAKRHLSISHIDCFVCFGHNDSKYIYLQNV